MLARLWLALALPTADFETVCAYRTTDCHHRMTLLRGRVRFNGSCTPTSMA